MTLNTKRTNTQQHPGAEVHVPLADHMGNVRHYYQFKSTKGNVTGQLVASYEYDAFGREVRAWGLNTPTENQPPGLPASRPWADLLPFHYSSKLRDVDSGFNYYGYRFYDPGAGRWLNRDPIGERGGVNLYGMVGNDAVNNVDFIGLDNAKPLKANPVNAKYIAGARDEIDNQLVLGGHEALEASEANRKANNGLIEYCGHVCEHVSCGGERTYSRTPLTAGGRTWCVVPPTIQSQNCPQGTRVVGFFHNHPNRTPLSQADTNIAQGFDKYGNLPRGGRGIIRRTGATRRMGSFDSKDTVTSTWEPSEPDVIRNIGGKL